MADDPCDQCGSQNFTIDAGRTFCENGHEQNKGPEVRSDDDDFGTQGKRINAKERTNKPKGLRVYRGKAANRLFLQAYQHILWKQCYALVYKKGLPAELWTVVRDLWSLQLPGLLHRVEEFKGNGEDPTGVLSSEMDSQDGNGREVEDHAERQGRSPALIDTICLCYLAILLLRLPISLQHILLWVCHEDLPYIRAIRHIPSEMRDKLPGEYHAALDTSTVLGSEHLQVGVSKLCAVYTSMFGVLMPPLNSTSLLYHFIKILALPLEMYSGVQRLNEITRFDFKYTKVNEKRRSALSYPEAQLISLIVVTTKLFFPFGCDNSRSHGQNSTEQATPSLDWNAWIRDRYPYNVRGRTASPRRKALIEVEDTDVFNMSTDQLDLYMNWYQQVWVNPGISEDDMNKEIVNIFPLQRLSPGKANDANTHHLHSSQSRSAPQVSRMYETQQPIAHGELEDEKPDATRPGTHYLQFHDMASLQQSPIAYIFHREAAEVSCLTPRVLLRAVARTEHKIGLWRREKKRAEELREALIWD